MVFMHRLELGNAVLGSVPGIDIHKGLVFPVHHDDIRIIIIPAGAAGGIPTQLTDLHGIAEDVFYGAVFKGSTAMGFNVHRIEPAGNGIESLAGEETAEHLPDV